MRICEKLALELTSMSALEPITRPSMSSNLDPQPSSSDGTRSRKRTKAKDDGMKPPAEFLWINTQEEDPRDRDASREKQAFIRARHHRLKKESQTRNLETSMQRRPNHGNSLTPKAVWKQNSKGSSSQDVLSNRAEITQSPDLCQSLETCISMAFPYLSRSTNQSVTLYLQHCKYLDS